MRDIYYSVINGIASRVVLFAINMIAVRLLASEEFGLFSYLLTVTSSIAAMSGLGMGVAANKCVAKHTESDRGFAKKIVFSSLLFVTVLAAVCTFLLMPFFDVTARADFKVGWMETLFMCLFVWLLNVSSVFEGALNGLGAYRKMAMNAIKVCSISLPSAAILLKTFGLIGGVGALLLYRFLSAALNGVVLLKASLLSFKFSVKVLFEKDVLKVVLGISLPTMLGSLMVGPAIAAAMNLVAQQSNGLKEVAYFSWVYQVYTVAIFLPNMLSGFFLSKLSRDVRSAFKFNQVLKINLIFSVTIAASLFIFKDVILRYAGSEYVGRAGLIFDAMTFVIVLFGFSASFASHWVATNRSWLGFGLNVIWAVVLLLVVWMCKDMFGGGAIAIGFFCAYLMQLVVQTCVFIFDKNGSRVG